MIILLISFLSISIFIVLNAETKLFTSYSIHISLFEFLSCYLMRNECRKKYYLFNEEIFIEDQVFNSWFLNKNP